MRQPITIKKEVPLVPTYQWLAGTKRYLAGFYVRGEKKFAITFPNATGIGGRINILARYIKKEKE